MRPLRVISGAQTGVDRAALDVALALDIPHGGWVPRQRRAEDGRIPDRYSLTEMSTSLYMARTRKNVEEADATLILTPTDLEPYRSGTWRTYTYAVAIKKPVLIVDLRGEPRFNAPRVHTLIKRRSVNVAGPRESRAPGVYERAYAFLMEVLQ